MAKVTQRVNADSLWDNGRKAPEFMVFLFLANVCCSLSWNHTPDVYVGKHEGVVAQHSGVTGRSQHTPHSGALRHTADPPSLDLHATLVSVLLILVPLALGWVPVARDFLRNTWTYLHKALKKARKAFSKRYRYV